MRRPSYRLGRWELPILERKRLYSQAEKTLADVEVAYLPHDFNAVVAVDKPQLTRCHDRVSSNGFFLWSIDIKAKKAASVSQRNFFLYRQRPF
jgi:hypothetical protein